MPRRADRAGEGRADRSDEAARRLPLRRARPGPGKTEIAKAFSAFLFGSEDRLVRLDMSEYQTPESLERLLGDADDAARQAAPLIASVRKQPFSVAPPRRVREGTPEYLGRLPPGLRRRAPDRPQRPHCRPAPLRDHPHLEPGLRDPGGPGRRLRRPASGEFDPATVLKSRRAVIPARVPEPARSRSSSSARSAARSCATCSRRSSTTVLERRGFRMRPWAVEWDEAAIDFLIEKGFSAELGARPLKRAVERHLLTRIATTIVERAVPRGRPVPLHHGARRDRPRRRLRRSGRGASRSLPPAEPPAGPARPRRSRGSRSSRRARRPRPPSSGASSRRSSERVRSWDDAEGGRPRCAREPAFWQSEDRHAGA